MTSAAALKRPTAISMWLPLAVMIGGTAALAAPDVRQPEEQDPGAAERRKESQKRWTLGAGVATMPRFHGSDEYKNEPAPLVDVQVGRFFAKTGEGIGFNVIKKDKFAAGVTLNWIQGYDADDVPNGVNEVDDALGARIFASARFGGVVAAVAGTQAVTETGRGLLINAGLTYPIRATRRLSISPSLGVTWGNEDYLNSYFGIDTFESAASGLSAYQPARSGFRDVSFRVGIGYRITGKVSAVGSIGMSHLLDQAADSPLVERQTNAIALLGLTYTFGR